MSCCCATPSAASLGFSIYLLIGYVPSVFYISVGLAFEWEDLSSKALWVFILLTCMFGALACFIALAARWVKEGRKLDFGAACTGALSLLLTVATTIWFVVVQMRLEWLEASLQARILVAGGTIMTSIIFVIVPQAWACWIWRALSLPPPSAMADEARLPLGRAPRRSVGQYGSDSELDEMDRDPRWAGMGARKQSMEGASDSEGEMYPTRRSMSMSKKGR